MRVVSTATLPLLLKNENGKNSIDSTNFLKNLGIAINKTNTTTVDVTFPQGWTKEKLTGPRAGWTVYKHKENNKDFYVFRHPITEGVSFICIINCVEETTLITETADPRVVKKPGHVYVKPNNTTVQKFSFERLGDKTGNPGC